MEEPFIAIGIDLGTTTTVLSYSINGQVAESSKGMPSALAITFCNEIVMGEEALEAIQDDPCCGVVNSKRLIGRYFEDPVVQAEYIKGENRQGPKIIKTVRKSISGQTYHEFVYELPNGSRFSPVDIASEVLKTIVLLSGHKKAIDKDMNKPDNERKVSVVVTVPAYFTLPQMSATDLAAEKAGLKKKDKDIMYRHVNEPNAGSIYYLMNIYQKKKEIIEDLTKKSNSKDTKAEEKK